MFYNIDKNNNNNNYHYLIKYKFILNLKYYHVNFYSNFLSSHEIIFYDKLISGSFSNDIMSSVLYFVNDKINRIKPPKNKITDNE